MNVKNKKVFITGGAGYLGSKLVEKLYPDNEIVVYSRDEAKQYFLKKRFPNVKCILGDVADVDNLVQSSKDCNIGIFCAALKQIEAVEENPAAGLSTIGIGALNSKLAAINNDFEAACMISSDKASASQTSYGALKLFSENVFVNNNRDVKPNLTACRYGNVTASKGSIIPVIWDAIKRKYILHLYDEEMTRFNIAVEDAIDLIYKSLDHRDSVIIPKISSFRVKDLFEIYHERFGLMYHVTEPRPNEKIHEILFSNVESRRINYLREDNIFLLGSSSVGSSYLDTNYSSEEYCITKEELDKTLAEHRYYGDNGELQQ